MGVGHGTGSAGWMQRAGLESILGLQYEGSSLQIDPCILNSWSGFEMASPRFRPVAH
jgi:cyclic beta-1,2-glucan synthetase